MALIRTESGCKVGWSTYDNRAEAEAAAEQAALQADRMFLEGYDFGYQSPGDISVVVTANGIEYRVTTP